MEPDELNKQDTIEVYEQCRHPLDVDDFVEAGKELAAAQVEVKELEDDFKTVRDEWKARISAVEAKITSISGRISRGYDIRETKCTVLLNRPDKGKKTCVRDDTFQIVWERDMTAVDRQMLLDMKVEEPSPDEPDEEDVEEEASEGTEETEENY